MYSSHVVRCLLLILQYLAVNNRVDCTPLKCSEDGPEICFPFRLVQRQPKCCGYPGFEITCSNNSTFLNLTPQLKLQVTEIDYKSELIQARDITGCTVIPFLLSNASASSPFHFSGKLYNVTIFNCSADGSYSRDIYQLQCSSSPGYEIYAVYSDDLPLFYFSLSSCTKMYTIQLPYQTPWNSYTSSVWSYSMNWSCSSSSKHQGNNKCSSRFPGGIGVDVQRASTECYSALPCQKVCTGKNKLKILLGTGISFGVLLLVVSILKVLNLRKTKKLEGDTHRFLDSYNARKLTRYSYSHIKRITNQFKDQLGEGGFGTVFKGNLSSDIFVAVKMLDKIKGIGDDFINEVSTIGRIHHVNVVRLVGYCADGAKRALVYEYLPNGSLNRFINPRDKSESKSLSLEKLQDIAVGIARGIEYIHQGCEKRILHFDIKPHNILLDEEFNPKVSDFGLAKLWSREQSAVSMTMARGTPGYIAPEVFSRNFGNVTVKSDVYSFGMLLLDMLGARNNENIVANSSTERYFPDWIYDSLTEGEEQGSWIQEGENAEVAKKLIITGLWCIQWYPVDRPSMKSVIQMLQGNIDGLCMPPKPFPSDDLPITQMTTYTESSNSEGTNGYASTNIEIDTCD